MNKLSSRKLIITVLAALFIGFNEQLELGIPQESIYALVTLIVGYVVAQGIVDKNG